MGTKFIPQTSNTTSCTSTSQHCQESFWLRPFSHGSFSISSFSSIHSFGGSCCILCHILGDLFTYMDEMPKPRLLTDHRPTTGSNLPPAFLFLLQTSASTQMVRCKAIEPQPLTAKQNSDLMFSIVCEKSLNLHFHALASIRTSWFVQHL